jgi:hypothetical protein
VAEDASFTPPQGLRAKAGRLAQRIVPDLDQWTYFRARRSDMQGRAADYDAWRATHAATPLSTAGAGDRPPHVVVVPYEGRDYDSWAPGTRNFYFEAAQVLAETQGESRVSVFHVEAGEPHVQWHTRLVDYLNDVRATHVLTHIEGDPGTLDGTWTWDTAWDLMSTYWDGALLGVMFDSAYRHTFLKGRFLAQMSPRFMLVDICMPMDGALVRGRPEVGPINMPMSDLSMGLVDERLARVDVEHDISFIGVLYPYRQQMIEALRAEGLSVVVNPHRSDEARTRQATMLNQPGWLEYMAGLASSSATINFSESAARPVQQLKTRVIEAGLAGTFLLTDDRDRTDLFWIEGEEYGRFDSVEDLPGVAESFLSDPARLDVARAAFGAKARELARAGFWGGIDEGLRHRGLPGVVEWGGS